MRSVGVCAEATPLSISAHNSVTFANSPGGAVGGDTCRFIEARLIVNGARSSNARRKRTTFENNIISCECTTYWYSWRGLVRHVLVRLRRLLAFIDHPRSDLVYNFGHCLPVCIFVCLSVCLSVSDDITFENLDVRVPIRTSGVSPGSSSYMKVIWSRSRSQEQERSTTIQYTRNG